MIITGWPPIEWAKSLNGSQNCTGQQVCRRAALDTSLRGKAAQLGDGRLERSCGSCEHR